MERKKELFGDLMNHTPAEKLEKLIEDLADKYSVSWVIVGALAADCNSEEELEFKVVAIS